MAEPFPHFVRVDRDGRQTRHFVVHLHEPRFTLELEPDLAAPDKIGRGLIKRVCLPNSWAGDYGRHARLMEAAQEFFARSAARDPESRPPR